MINLNGKLIDYNPDLTMSKAFSLAGVDPNKQYIASLNGKFVLYSTWDSTHIPDDSEVVFVSVSTGG